MNADDLKATIAEEMANRDLAAEMAANVERQVDNIRAKSTTKIEAVAKLLVYGVLGGLIGFVAVIVVLLGLFRAVDVVLPPNPGSWSTWALFGAIFCVIGFIAWAKRPRIGPSA